jgi:hypothetical protein
MLAVQEWAENKPILIAIAAPWVANFAQDLHTVFEQHKDWSIQNYKLPITDRSQWYKLYRSHRSTFGVLRTIFSSVCGEKVTTIGYYVFLFLIRRSLRKKYSGYRPSPREVHFVGRIIRRITLASFELLKGILSGVAINPKAKEKLLKHVETNIEFAFFIKVTTPCWILYGMAPVILYREAKKGDADAIEKLLRLDSLMIHEPYVSDAIALLHSSSGAYKDMLSAPNKMPDVRISLKSIKYSIGGLISALSQTIGQPLTAPQIRALFNAVVKDSDPEKYRNEQPEDLDFPENDDSFYRRIKEKHDFWLHMFHPDKTKFLNVRERRPMK